MPATCLMIKGEGDERMTPVITPELKKEIEQFLKRRGIALSRGKMEINFTPEGSISTINVTTTH